MRVLEIAGPGQVRVAERPRPEPADGEELVRVTHAAVCGTDRKLAARGADPPRVPGHEFAGCTDSRQAVGVHPDVGCGACEVCAAGLENRCPQRSSIGLDRDGGFAEWAVVPARHVLPLGKVPITIAPLLEPLACCLHASDLLRGEEAAKPPTGGGETKWVDRAAVVGAGAMGVLCMWALRARGARVVVVQRSAARRRLAAALGADAALAPADDPRPALGGPPDAAIVTAPGAPALVWALEHVRVGGTVHAFAGTSGGALVDANLVHYRHLRLVGSTGSPLASYTEALGLVETGRVDLARLPRTTVGFDAAASALLEPPPASVLRTIVDIGGGSS